MSAPPSDRAALPPDPTAAGTPPGPGHPDRRLPPPVNPTQPDIPPTDWYLGLDIGATALSAVLLYRPTGAVYPIYWWLTAPATTDPTQPPWPLAPCFRIPNSGYLAAQQLAQSPQMPTAVGLIAQKARYANLYPDTDLSALLHTLEPNLLGEAGVHLDAYLPLLQLGWPHYSPQTLRWEPQVQWSETQSFALGWCLQTLQSLLRSLLAPTGTEVGGMLRSAAVGLDHATFQTALGQLAGICVSYGVEQPSDAYAYNVREAILGAGLVAQPEQIILVEGVIAALVSELQGLQQTQRSITGGTAPATADASGVALSQAGAWTWDGVTLVIEAGASHTDLLVVDLPEPIATLTYADCWLRGVDYGGYALDQDILCQLLLPQFIGRPAAFTGLVVPTVGEPDRLRRARLQQQLAGSALGQRWLQVAQQLKWQLLQEASVQPEVPRTLTLDDQVISLSPQDLEMQVLLPYLQRLNRELNGLLGQAGVVPAQIRQVICTGGTGAIGAMTRWLRQKLPNATILQDTQPKPNQPGCSRVAYGLAFVPLYPQVITPGRQLYSDVFLLLELLRALPTEPLSLTQILARLASRGINTDACRSQIGALLQGQIPQGLGLGPDQQIWLSPSSQQHPMYAAIAAAPLFTPLGPDTYVLNDSQAAIWREYLTHLLAGKHQPLTEPLVVSGLPSP